MKKIKFYTLLFACMMLAVVTLPISAAMAQTDVFQFEVAGLYIQEKEDDAKLQFYGLHAGYHFTPVPLT